MSSMEFSDSVDSQTELKVRDVLAILKRSFVYVWPVKHLFILKFVLMAGSLIPLIVAPWPMKVLIDHVLLKQPLAESTIRRPWQPVSARPHADSNPPPLSNPQDRSPWRMLRRSNALHEPGPSSAPACAGHWRDRRWNGSRRQGPACPDAAPRRN